MTKRRWFLLAFAATFPILLISALPPSIALALQTPGTLVVKQTLLLDKRALVVGALVTWLSLGIPIWILGCMLTSRKLSLRIAAATVLFGACTGLLLIARSQERKMFVGTFEYGFETSNFYPNGDCWRPAYWVTGMPNDPRIASEPAVTVTFIGNASSLGSYGHLGTYVRKVTVTRLLDIRPTEPCSR